MNISCCFSTILADNEEASACENENDLTDQVTGENIYFFHMKIEPVENKNQVAIAVTFSLELTKNLFLQ